MSVYSPMEVRIYIDTDYILTFNRQCAGTDKRGGKEYKKDNLLGF